jgi:hypothetical protein
MTKCLSLAEVYLELSSHNQQHTGTHSRFPSGDSHLLFQFAVIEMTKADICVTERTKQTVGREAGAG